LWLGGCGGGGGGCHQFVKSFWKGAGMRLL
jgi:hypothetical protein